MSETGPATVIDGDSLEIGATSIRLYGVDAPEGRQTCGDGAATWNCGRAATEKLRELVDARKITCRRMDTDSYGRTVAVCRNGAVDLAAEMAAAGLALAYRRYSDDYVDEESRAHAQRRGVWASTFTPPWDWRRANNDDRESTDNAPAARGTAPSSRCRIKGNINDAGEHIYHVPGSRSYDATGINESRGERWFCSEAEARRAGWRAPRG
ncbi:MAG TPA: thermonuclease family protein [Gammaproteobacteria bacterium]